MIERLLIANRGEIALRVIRACREMGLQTVAFNYDRDAQADAYLDQFDQLLPLVARRPARLLAG